ncbi:MAG: TatD family hydrolase [Myxococcota bacterium]
MKRFFDTHAHLDGSAFRGEVDEVLSRAEQAGVTDIVLIGASDGFESNPAALQLARRSENLHATVGIHPHDAIQATDSIIQEIEGLASDPKVVAIGETGLDYYYDHSPRHVQQEAFRSFIRMAKRHNKPCVVHTRDAEEDTLRILEEEDASSTGGIIHCFSGTQFLARGAVELGFYISFSGILTFKRSDDLRRIARLLPRERVLVETDCPYLAPVPFRGKRNEPSYVLHTAQCLAEIWDTTLEDVKEVTGRNALNAFRLPDAQA